MAAAIAIERLVSGGHTVALHSQASVVRAPTALVLWMVLFCHSKNYRDIKRVAADLKWSKGMINTAVVEKLVSRNKHL